MKPENARRLLEALNENLGSDAPTAGQLKTKHRYEAIIRGDHPDSLPYEPDQRGDPDQDI